MRNKMNVNKYLLRASSNPFIKWIIVPVLLLIFWIVLSMLYGSYRSVSVLQYTQDQNRNNNFFNKKLLKGQKLVGDFIAKDNHLGIVAVGFSNVPKVEFTNEDILLFRIKQKNTNSWLYENTYRSGEFTPDDYFPFGFREITNSRGKEYVFEIISENGNSGNALETKNYDPIYIVKYKYPKEEIFGSSHTLIKFIFEKFITFITNFESLLSSVVFLLPFIFYIAWAISSIKQFEWILSPQRKWINKRINIKNILAFIVIGLLYYDVIFYNFIVVGFMLGTMGLWIGIIFLNKYKSSVTFIFAFSLIFLSIIAIYFHLAISINKSSSFAYFLMITATIQSLHEYKQELKEKLPKKRS